MEAEGDLVKSLGRPASERAEKRIKRDNIERIIIDGQLANSTSECFSELKDLCDSRSEKGEYIAARRYVIKNNLLAKSVDDGSDDEDEEYTEFGPVKCGGERFSVDISTMGMPLESGSPQFNDQLVKLIYKTTRKP